MTEYKNVHVALAAAQGEFQPPKKDSNNPHFKSKYADLASVVEVVKPVLSRHGIAFYHTTVVTERFDMMRTVLVHGASETEIWCDVPLIIAKNDMQGYKSATTYAKRIGLESVTGIAPEDDDGNAAAANAPKPASSAHMKRELGQLDKDMVDVHSAVSLTALWNEWRRKMDNEQWPVAEEDDETSFRFQVIERFKARKAHLEQPAMEAAE